MEFVGVVEWVGAQDDVALLSRLAVLEEERRRVEAETAVLLGELEDRKTYRVDAHATMWGLLRSRLGWSDRECRERMRVARLVREFRDAGECLHDAQVSVANIAEVARGRANPRIGDRIGDEIGAMLTAACRDEHVDVRALVDRWELLTEPVVAHEVAERADEARTASFRTGRDGGELSGSWGPLEALSNREIFDLFVQTEFDADWEATVAEHGDGASPGLMPRTAGQRRADALTRILRTAAASTVAAAPVSAEVVIHIDHHTASDVMTMFGLFPERCRDPFDDPWPSITQRRCHTTDGDPVDPITAMQMALEGHVRFAIADEEGVPVVWGRKRRLFTGQARQAVLSMSTRCTHPGCRVRAGCSEIDHTVDFADGGTTDPHNGNPRCRRHNNAKNHGFTTRRDPTGTWHTYRPDGTKL